MWLCPFLLVTVPGLSPATRGSLDVLLAALDARPRDWGRYAAQAAEFHLKNARSWASAVAGADLAGQIDPDFTLDAATAGNPG